jgi:hypothetical protein
VSHFYRHAYVEQLKTKSKMKNKEHYNRFILFANAPVCAYGHTTIRVYSKRVKYALLNKCRNFFLRKASG